MLNHWDLKHVSWGHLVLIIVDCASNLSLISEKGQTKVGLKMLKLDSSDLFVSTMLAAVDVSAADFLSCADVT